MAKVLLHNLTIPFLNEPEEAFLFDHNAIFFAEEGDIVVLRKNAPHRVLLKYFQSINIVPKNIHFFISKIPATPFSVFEDNLLKQELRIFLSTEKNIRELDVFIPSGYEEYFASTLHLKYSHANSQYERFVSKGLFKKFAQSLAIPICTGFSFVPRKGLLWAVFKLFVQGVQKIIIKQDDGVAGSGSVIITRTDFIKMLALKRKTFLPATFVVPSLGKGYVVEEWHDDVTVSPSVQCFIDTDGNPHILSFHKQVFKSDKTTFIGCRSEHWLEKELIHILENYAHTYAQFVSQEGYRGHVAFDSIVSDSKGVYFTEMNPRRVIPSYPFQIIEKLGYTRETMPPYIAVTITRPEWSGVDPSFVLEDLGDLLYLDVYKKGVIPFDCKLLYTKGTVVCLLIGTSKEDVEGMVLEISGESL